MEPRYSEFADRILRTDGLLRKLAPSDIFDRERWREVNAADDATVAGKRTISNAGAFALVRGGLLYALDDLDGCHRFFQDVHSDLGSYWHGMMHRREADFDNARFWFRRAGALPVFDRLHGEIAAISHDMAKQITWDPYLFTGMCEQARHGADDERGELPQLQRAEFEVLFDYSWRQAFAA
jgi:hypothetical protein